MHSGGTQVSFAQLFDDNEARRAYAVIVTSAGDGDHDFVSRVFAPNAGLPEDPVTGSAHCQLAPFWALQRGMLVMAFVAVLFTVAAGML